MTKEEARVIYKSWQDYIEIADKFFRLMLPVPESFLPYPAKTLEEALLIIAKDFFDSGDKVMSEKIKELMVGHLLGIKSDEEAITDMKRKLDFIEQNPKLKKALLKSLKECQEGWIKSRSQANNIVS